MEAYADSSFLVSLFGEDANSLAAQRWMSPQAESLPFNPLHRLEVRNGIRLAVRRGELDPADRRTALAQLDADLRQGLLAHSPIPWTDALRRAETLSAAHTETLGNRAADILHVAIALESGAKTFLSFDAAQRALAEAEGLAVHP